MKRRDLLRTGSGALLGGALAGCLSDGESGGNGQSNTPTGTEPTATHTAEPTTTDGGFEWPVDPTVFGSRGVGDRSRVDFPENNRPITLRLWNSMDTERTLLVALTTPDDAPGYRCEVTFPADGVLVLSLEEPDSYSVTVGSLGDLSVPFGQFDCNQTTYDVRLDADGLDHEVVSTELACPDPEPGETTVTAGEGDCGSSDRARVAFIDGSVVVEGAMETPDPCHDVRLRTADYLPEAETLELVLEAVSEDTGCVDCIGQVPYEARAAFANDYPREVVVRHAGPAGVREVVRVSRGYGE